MAVDEIDLRLAKMYEKVQTIKPESVNQLPPKQVMDNMFILSQYNKVYVNLKNITAA